MGEMADYRELFERAAARYEPFGLTTEALLFRRDRRRRYQRITAGAVGMALFAATLWVVLTGTQFGRNGTPAVPVPAPTSPPSPRSSPPEPINPSYPTTTDVSVVDVQTGRPTQLPSTIRSSGVTHLQVSPDGGRVAFESDGLIKVANLDGSDLRTVAEGAAPAWTPDGEQLVYTYGYYAIRITDVASGRTREIFRSENPVYHPNVGPDGERILFTWLKPGTPGFALWTIPVRRGQPRALPLPHGAHTFPAFGTYSPDGTMIAFRKTQYDGIDTTQMTSGGLWLANADGSDPHLIGPYNAWMSQINATALWPMWSPDGTRVAYQGIIKNGVKIVDIRDGSVDRIGAAGTNPVWLDNDTLIIEEFEQDRATG